MDVQQKVLVVSLLVLYSMTPAQAEPITRAPILGVIAIAPQAPSVRNLSVSALPSRSQRVLLEQATLAPTPYVDYLGLDRFYFGGSVGRAELNGCVFNDRSLETQGFNLSTGAVQECEDATVGWKAYAGYEYNRFLAVEAGYGQLGTDYMLTYRGRRNPPVADGTTVPSVDVDFRGLLDLSTIFITGIFRIPFNEHVEPYIRLGVHRWESSGSVENTPGDEPEGEAFGEISRALDQNGFDYTYGLGVQYRFNNGIAIRTEWEKYALSEVLQSVDLLTFSMNYRFR